ncbi:MAG: cell division topological specificity factor MinE [Pseudomonadota bacterium]
MASFFSFLIGEKKTTASVAKERLQIILAHERSGRNPPPDYMADLQRDIIAVIAKYIPINLDDIKVSMDRQENLDVLEVKIELPDKK